MLPMHLTYTVLTSKKVLLLFVHCLQIDCEIHSSKPYGICNYVAAEAKKLAWLARPM